ncbi:MAG TPA: glycine cleavage system H protein [bacterium]|jgi:glycine cleavage system H protein|nr:glycine cleavage system H protein [bacterium]
MPTPTDRLYTKTHEWIKFEGDGASVGLTEFAVHAIKDIVFLELPEAGRTLEAGKPFGVIESVKAVFDLNAPMGGKIVSTNDEVECEFAPLSEDPYGKGWLLKLSQLSGDKAALLDAAAYDKHCAEDHH